VSEILIKFVEANLTVNLTKSEFSHAQVTFLGHVVGSGMVRSLSAKVQAVIDYPPPTSKKEFAPDFQKQFILIINASSLGAGAVLMQSNSQGVEHPICYFSHKFDTYQRNYSTIEQETLALVLSLRYFDVHLNTTRYPIMVYMDHNLLTYLYT